MIPFARISKYGNRPAVSDIDKVYTPSGNTNGACLFLQYKDGTLYGIGGGTGSNYCFGLGSNGTTNYTEWQLVFRNVKRFVSSLVEFAVIQTTDNKFYYSGYQAFFGTGLTGFTTTWTEITSTFTKIFTPAQINSIVDIQVAWSQIFVQLEDGTLWGIGDNVSGVLANGSTAKNTDFKLITSEVKKFTIRLQTMYVIKNDSTLWISGQNSGYLFGAATPNNYFTLTKFNFTAGVKILDATLNGSGAYWLLQGTGAPYMMVSGNTLNGNLGNGSTSNAVVFQRNVTTGTDNLPFDESTKIFINSDGINGCCIHSNGKLYGTGENTTGRIGTGNTTNASRWTPAVNAQNVSNLIDFSASDHGTVYLTGAGDVYWAGRPFKAPFTAYYTTFTKLVLPRDSQ